MEDVHTHVSLSSDAGDGDTADARIITEAFKNENENATDYKDSKLTTHGLNSNSESENDGNDNKKDSRQNDNNNKRKSNYFGHAVITLSQKTPLTSFNYPLLLLLIPSIICVIGANRSNFFGQSFGQSSSSALLFIISNIVSAIFFIMTLIYGWYKYKKDVLNEGNDWRYADSIYKLFNKNHKGHDIDKDEMEIFSFSSEATLVLLTIMLLIYGNIAELIINLALYSYNFDENCITILDSAVNKQVWNMYSVDNRGGCAIEVSTYASTYVFASALVCMSFVAQPSMDCKGQIKKGKEALLSQYGNLKFFNDKIIESLKEWEEKTFEWRQNRFETFCLFLVSFIFHIGAEMLRLNGDLFDIEKYGFGYILIIILFIIFDSLCIGIVVITAVRVCRHYEYPSIIMNSMIPSLDELEIHFSIEKNSKTIDFANDIIGWWLLRRNYILTIIHTFAISFDKFISVALIGGVIAALLYVFDDSQDDRKALFLFGAVAIIFVIYVFAFNGVSYLTSQRDHLQMLNQLKLLLDRRSLDKMQDSANSGNGNGNGNDENNDDGSSIAKQIMSNIETDMKDNEYAFKVLGFTLNDTFMAALTTAVGTFAINSVIDFVLDN